MMFNIGDLVILLVVAIILAVYRQLDRNNRSIDKVKRFVERAQNEIDEIVSEKVTMLKDIGIELDVHQKAAREVLKRIHAIEEELNQRSGAMEEIGHRLGEYERALHELVQMTQRTEENISRVKEESEYVDKVGRRIKAVQSRIEAMESSLPGIVSGFEKQNIDRLETVERRFFEQGEQRMRDLDGRVESAAGRVQDFSEQVARLQAETDEQVQSARAGLRDLSDGFERNIETRAEELSRETVAAITSARDDALETADTVRDQQQQIRGEMDSVMDQMRGLLEEQFRDYGERIEDLARRGAALETEALAALRVHIAENIENLRYEQEETLSHSVEELRHGVQVRIDEARQETERSISAFQERTGKLNEEFDQWRERIRQYVQELDQQVAALRTDTERTGEEQRAALELHINHVSQQFVNNQRAVDQSFEQLQQKLEETGATITRDQNDIAESLRKRGQALQNELHAELEQVRESFTAQQTALDGLQRETQSRILQYQEDNTKETLRLQAKIQEFTDTFATRIDRDEQELEHKVLSSLEQRLSDYETELNYRFGKIEEANGEVDELEQAMRRTMERVSDRIRADFRLFSEEMETQRRGDRSDAERQMGELQSEINQLESGLNELKERAYVSVSEKLKVFEDEFFADLRSRSDRIEQRITEWNTDIEEQLEGITRDHLENRRAFEETQNVRLSEQLTGLSDEINGRLKKAEEQIDLFRGDLAGRLEAAEHSLGIFEQDMAEQVQSARENSQQHYRTEFARYDEQINSEMKEFHGRINTGLKDVQQQMMSGTAELEQIVQAARSDMTVWQTRVLNQLQSSEADVENQLADFRVRTSENLHSLRQEYTTERERLVRDSEDDRRRITQELQRLSASLAQLETALEERSESALQGFSDRFVVLREEMDGYRDSVTNSIEENSSEFRRLVVDTRDQLQSMQTKLFGRIEEDAKLLSVNLEEIDKRQKAFIDQTQIFERADGLKIQLEEQIGELKADLARVEASRAEIREIENQFTKIRKVSAEAGEKMSRFMAEKRRIDLLEEDYRRLINLSQSAESKLERISSSEEQIQEVGAYLRSLEELQTEVAARFDRLEKRRQTIDQTVDALDSNNHALAELEGRLESVQTELSTLPPQVAALTRQIQLLSKDRTSADQAIGQLQKLDTSLQEIEERMNNLQTAREWLAGTETRLEQIQRDAGDQVKLLGTLLRDESRKEPQKGGAPASPVRDTIQKLARQGWKVDEIARATKVSKGEVELILELSSKSG